MSEKIIKAGRTRLLPAEKRPHKEPHKAESGEAREDAAIGEMAKREAEMAASYQDAYDEVIEAAQQEVALLLKDARSEARGITDKAEAEAEKAREAAHTDGFEKGLSIGFADGTDRAERALEDLLREGQEEVDRVLDSAYAERDRLLGEMEPKLLNLALNVAGKVIGYELDQSNEAFVSLVKTALNIIQNESRVTLRINAEQHVGAFRSKAEVRLKTARGSVEADIVADPAIEPGGCLIETDNGTVDASVDTQLEQIAQNMGIE